MGILPFDRSKRRRYPGDDILAEIRAAAARGNPRGGRWGGPPRPARHPQKFTFRRGSRRSSAGEWRLAGLLCCLLFVGTLAILQYRDATSVEVASRDPRSWIRAAIDPPYVEPQVDGWEPAEDALSAPVETASVSARFGLCHSGGGTNCVVDGDTFWSNGEKIRIADIDTPETHPPRCAAEAAKGAAATRRLQTLLNQGPFALEASDRDTDRYGRKLRIVTRNGESIGSVLVGEGLARWYGGGRQPWC